MDESIAKLTNILKSNGYSNTKPRQLVFTYLIGKESVPVSSMTEALSSTINRASIYRILELFQQLGIIQRINVGWKYKIELSDIFTEHHHHLTCINCDRVFAINETTLEQFVEGLAAQYDFVPTKHQVEVQGYCSNCKQSRSLV